MRIKEIEPKPKRPDFEGSFPIPLLLEHKHRHLARLFKSDDHPSDVTVPPETLAQQE
jgi:hypothetical protein